MGLSSFLRGANAEPKKSAFDDIPDEVRQAIANDLCAIIECVKCWRPAIQSPEHAKAMIDEVMTMARKLGTKLIGAAMTGNLDSMEELFGTPEAIERLGIPEAIKDIIARVKNQMDDKPPTGEVPNGSAA